MHRQKNHLNETRSYRTEHVLVDPVICRHVTTDSLRRNHDVIVIETQERWFAICLILLDPEFVLKRRVIVLSERAPKTSLY